MTLRPARPTLRAAVVLHVHGLERAADAAGATPDNYPPYDLLRTVGPAPSVADGPAAGPATGSPTGPAPGLRLVFAVAGFGPHQLEIAVAGDQFTVSGEGTGDGDPGRFLHRGIATRRFRRAFRLAPGLDVVGADLHLGLLTVSLAQRDDRADPASGCPGDRVARRVAIRPVTRPGTI